MPGRPESIVQSLDHVAGGPQEYFFMAGLKLQQEPNSIYDFVLVAKPSAQSLLWSTVFGDE
jgi:hypothetical protein